jgi:small multidrug resistance family-3 protein
MLRTLAVFVLAAVCEIAGCFTAWMWLRLGRSPLWLAAGTILLVLFAVALTQVDAAFAGRAFAAYGGVYIAASLAWGRLVEHRGIDRSDLLGALLCLSGAALILFGRRADGG